MNHEKLLKRSDGSKIKIRVRFWIRTIYPMYDVEVLICEPRKRTFYNVYSSDDWSYRKLSMEEREKYVYEKQLEHVTEDEIMEAKMEMWNILKPGLIV